MVPIIAASLKLVTAGGVSLAFGGDRIVHHILALAKLEPANSSLDAPQGDGDWTHALTYVSVRKLSPVVMIAQQILASLLASATAASRSGPQRVDPVGESAFALANHAQYRGCTDDVCSGCPAW